MSALIVPYKKLDLTKVRITKPNKFKGKYRSFVAYDGSPLYMQTSSFKIAALKDFGRIEFAVNRRSTFQECMNRFDKFCTNYISEHRDVFFPGKNFPSDKIPGSWIQSVTNNLFSASLDESTLLRNQLDRSISKRDLQPNQDAVAVVYVSDIVYVGNSIQISYVIQQMRVFQQPMVNQEWSLDMDSDSEDDLHTLRDARFVPLHATDEADEVPRGRASTKKSLRSDAPLPNPRRGPGYQSPQNEKVIEKVAPTQNINESGPKVPESSPKVLEPSAEVPDNADGNSLNRDILNPIGNEENNVREEGVREENENAYDKYNPEPSGRELSGRESSGQEPNPLTT